MFKRAMITFSEISLWLVAMAVFAPWLGTADPQAPALRIRPCDRRRPGRHAGRAGSVLLAGSRRPHRRVRHRGSWCVGSPLRLHQCRLLDRPPVVGPVAGPAAGVAADVALPWLLPLALGTIALGMIGALASRELRRMQGYLLIGSIGIMLVALALFTSRSIAAGLYYLVHSTVISAGMFLLTDLIAVQRGRKDDLLVAGPPIRQDATLGLLFFVGSIAVAGLPPLSGFLGKAMILEAAVPAPSLTWIWTTVLAKESRCSRPIFQ